MPRPQPHLQIILPCFNPTTGWVQQLLNIHLELSKLLTTSFDWIIIDDGSSKSLENDISLLQKQDFPFHFLSNKSNKGKGYTLRRGVEHSTANILIFTDIDFPYTINSFIKLFDALNEQKFDIAFGVRDESYYHKIPKQRRAISRLLKHINSTIFNLPANDTQCGLKGFNSTGKDIFLSTHSNGFLVDLEFLKSAAKQKHISMKPVPVVLRDNITLSKVKPSLLMKESLNFLKILLR